MTADMKKTETTVSGKQKRRKIVSLDRKKARAGWLFVLPFVIGFVIIYLPMVVESLRYSFSELDAKTNTISLVGFKNYIDAFRSDAEFTQKLVSGLQKLAFDIPAIVIFSLFMAIMLNQKMAGRGFFRAVFFIPVILSTGLMETMAARDTLTQYMESSSGIEDGSGSSTATQLVSSMDLQKLFDTMKVGDGLVTYITDIINNIYDIVNRSGVQMLIFLSGLQSISPAIYESCKIDGATAWETFWKITFPMITPMILVNTIYTVIDSFTSQQNPVMKYIADVFAQNKHVESAAMSWIYFTIVIAIIGLVAAILSAFVFYQRKSE